LWKNETLTIVPCFRLRNFAENQNYSIGYDVVSSFVIFTTQAVNVQKSIFLLFSHSDFNEHVHKSLSNHFNPLENEAYRSISNDLLFKKCGPKFLWVKILQNNFLSKKIVTFILPMKFLPIR